jgi:hypothetical protein
MDKFENAKMRTFVDCALNTNACLPAQPSVAKTSPKDITSGACLAKLRPEDCVKELDANTLFRGKWEVAMGLNPLFDTHKCQRHYFKPLGHPTKDGIVATFEYRVGDGDNEFPRYGGKILKQHPKHQGLLSLRLLPEYMDYEDKW